MYMMLWLLLQFGKLLYNLWKKLKFSTFLFSALEEKSWFAGFFYKWVWWDEVRNMKTISISRNRFSRSRYTTSGFYLIYYKTTCIPRSKLNSAYFLAKINHCGVVGGQLQCATGRLCKCMCIGQKCIWISFCFGPRLNSFRLLAHIFNRGAILTYKTI